MSDKEKDNNNNQDQPESQSNFPTVSMPDSSAVIGGEIGPYKLLSVLGEGGFGIVYLAEQKRPVKRTVALKIIKPGMDTKQVIARFEAERQALALLEHPNIAHVFTAGATESGRPYFAMEYIKGSPITEYCDHNQLNIKDRLELFIQVCEAIQHAHQKGIIHRDIKPSNIIVSVQDSKAVPKVIDFGVAKAVNLPLTEKTMFTQQGQLIGTPEYMSPEQADLKEKDIDTRTDIYSLGVVLYELLAGALPFDPKTLREGGYAEIQRIIREQEPPRPSTKLSSLGENGIKIAESRHIELSVLVKNLHKELEWIPLMAIRKERDQRYKTASDLAEDVQNYLDGNPLVAGPESAVYRTKKFIKKRKGLVAAVGSIVSILFISLVVISNLYFNSEELRVVAEDSERAAQEAMKKAEVNNETLLYAEYIDQAQEAFENTDMKLLNEKLERCNPGLRSWEWNYTNWLGSRNSAQREFLGSKDYVGSIAYSPDGQYIVATNNNDTILLWDSITEELLWSKMLKSDSKLLEVAFSPTNPYLFATCFSSGKVALWDLSTRKQVQIFFSGDIETSVGGGDLAFSPDGNSIIVGSKNGKLELWNIIDGELIWSVNHKEPIYWIDFNPDGQHVASAGQGNGINIWDIASHSEPTVLEGHTDTIVGVSFSPDGQNLVSGSRDSTVRLWDIKTGNELQKWHINDVIRNVAFSPSASDKYVAALGYYRGIEVWDVKTGQKVWFPQEASGYSSGLAFSPNGKSFVITDKNNVLKTYATRKFYNFKLLGHGHWDSSNAFSANSIVCSGDNKKLVSGHENGVAKLWDINSGRELLNLWVHTGAVSKVATNYDGSLVITGTSRGAIQVWNAAGKALKSFTAHNGMVTGIAINQTEDMFFSSGEDGKIIIWDLKNLKQLSVLGNHEEGVLCMDLSADNSKLVTGGKDKSLMIWDTSSGAIIFSKEHEDAVVGVAFDQSSELIVSACSDGNIRVWNSETGDLISKTLSHRSGDIPVIFSPDSKRIISSTDNTIKIWDTETGQALLKLDADSEGESGSSNHYIRTLAVGSDLKSIIAGLSNGSIVIFKYTEPDYEYEAWDTTEYARELVDKLYGQHHFYYDVVEYLQNDNKLKEETRRAAIDIATARQEDAITLCKEVWQTTSDAILPEDLLKVNLRKAERANLLKPNDFLVLGLLGDIQYKSGQYEASFVNSTKAIELYKLFGKRVGSVEDSEFHRKILLDIPEEKVRIFIESLKTTQLKLALSKVNPEYKGELKCLYEEGEMVSVNISNEPIVDITPLKGLSLRFVNLSNTNVNNISALRGMPLKYLNLEQTLVEDLNVLKTMPLRYVVLPRPEMGKLEVIRRLESGCSVLKSSNDHILNLNFSKDFVINNGDNKIIYDLSNNGLNGNIYGASISKNKPSGLEFRRKKDRIEINSAVLDHKADWTWSGWIYPYHYHQPGTIYSEGTGITFEIAIHDSGGMSVAIWNKQYPSNWLGWGPESNLANMNTWNFLVVTLENGDVGEGILKVYVNGNLIYSGQGQMQNTDPSQRYAVIGDNVGAYYAGQGHKPFKGKIAQIKIFDHVLPEHEIQSVYYADARKIILEKGEREEVIKENPVYQVWENILDDNLEEAVSAAEGLYVLPYQKEQKISKGAQVVLRKLAERFCKRGEASERSGDFLEAINNYEKAINVDSTYEPALNSLAWLQATCRNDEIQNIDLAVKNAISACELTNWENWEFLGTLAAIYSLSGNYEEAVKWQEKAIELMPEDSLEDWKSNFEYRLNLYKSPETDHKVVRWDFNEGSGDTVHGSIADHDGTLNNDIKWVSGQDGGALLFDGFNGYVEGNDIEADFPRGYSARTISAWINCGKTAGADRNIFHYGTAEDAPTNFHLFVGGSGQVSVGNGYGYGFVTSRSYVNDYQWHHVVGIYEGAVTNRLKIYVDGIEENSKISYVAPNTGMGNNWRMGVFLAPGQKAFNGIIDDVSVYNWALSTEEIQAAYKESDHETLGYNKSVQLASEAFNTRKQILGPEHPETLANMSSLASTHYKQGRYDKAEQLYTEVLDLQKKVLGPEHSDNLRSMNGLAWVYDAQNNYDKSEQLFSKIVNVRKRTLGPENQYTLISTGELAWIYHRQGKHEKAGNLFTEVIDIQKRILGSEHRDVLVNMSRLANVYSSQNHYEKSLQLFTITVDKQKHLLGPESLDALYTMPGLAWVYYKLGSYDKSLELYMDILEGRKNILGHEHRDTLEAMSNLAWFYREQGNYDQSEQLHTEALDIRKRVLGPKNPETLANMSALAWIYFMQGRIDESVELNIKTLDIQEEVIGQENPDTLNTMSNLAWSYESLGHLDKAVKYHSMVFDIRKRNLGPEHPDTLNSMGILAWAYNVQGNYGKSEELFTKVIEGQKKVLGVGHADTLSAMDELLMVKGLQGLVNSPNKIPSQAEPFDGHHYFLCIQQISWNEAKEFAESVGGHLATITTKEENDWIVKTFPPSYNYWLGGTDEAKDGEWKWVTGEKWEYSSWNKDEPNNFGGTEQFLSMWGNGNWNDENGENENLFLIEWDQ